MSKFLSKQVSSAKKVNLGSNQGRLVTRNSDKTVRNTMFIHSFRDGKSRGTSKPEPK